MISMVEYVDAVGHQLSVDLVSGQALSQIRAIAKQLPPLSVAGFECRLGAGQDRVDFQINLRPLALNLPARSAHHPEWFSEDILGRWLDPESVLHERVRDVWLGFDLVDENSETPVSSIVFGLDQVATCDARALTEVAACLCQPSVKVKSNLRLCVDSLPGKATISHVGRMLSRQSNGIRVRARGLVAGEVRAYLSSIGSTDANSVSETVAGPFAQFVDATVLLVDVGETVEPGIGLECFLNLQPHREPRWQSLLSYLVDRGLCTVEKHDALLAWPGLTQANGASSWPVNVTWGDRLLGGRALSVFWRKINHIKLLFERDSLSAKAYLAFGHRWLGRRE